MREFCIPVKPAPQMPSYFILPSSTTPDPALIPLNLSQVQTAAVNILNLVTSHPDLSVRAKSSLGEERSVVPALMALLDHSLPVLRAKGLVAVLLLCRCETWACLPLLFSLTLFTCP